MLSPELVHTNYFEDREEGNKYRLSEIRDEVLRDPELQNLTKEEEQELVAVWMTTSQLNILIPTTFWSDTYPSSFQI